MKSKAMNAIDLLLEEPLVFPDDLFCKNNSRVQDDCDGDHTQTLDVYFSADGDAWIKTQHPYRTLRFRSEFGGGKSPRVRNALIVLAEAIRRDNAARPQDIVPAPDTEAPEFHYPLDAAPDTEALAERVAKAIMECDAAGNIHWTAAKVVARAALAAMGVGR